MVSGVQAGSVTGNLHHHQVVKPPLMNARQVSGETTSFAPSGSLESRTATSPGRLRATSTQLPSWPL